MRPLATTVLSIAFLLSPGCGSSKPSAPKPSAPKPAEIIRVPAGRISLDDYLPKLDEGRVEIAPPKGWSVPARHKNYLVRFAQSRTIRLPRIWVTVEPSAIESMDNVTEENVREFADLIAEGLKAKGVTPLEAVIPMIISDRPCARYVRRSSFKIAGSSGVTRLTAERQILVTLIRGRLYTVDLHTPEGKITASRDAGYSVLASLRTPAAAPDKPSP